jgi:hypothetical protein
MQELELNLANLKSSNKRAMSMDVHKQQQRKSNALPEIGGGGALPSLNAISLSAVQP